ncbi:glycoside hydrolase family 104 protein [Paraburkholderia sediminicola]|uniref:glycoside hydrolase family 24 protein n=1 Tax=Paraburkholderia sediminicola TaxID=458836 RepID=UPI0038BA0271
MDNNQGGIVLLIVAVAAAVYFLNQSGSSSDSGGDTDVAGSALGGATGDFMDLFSGSGGNTSNRTAFLAMIGQSEVGASLIGETDSGYNVLCGATPSNPLTFSDYSTHPDILNQALDSTAAGLYQINHPTWLTLCKQTGLSDFSPATQDAMAIQLITNKGALADVDAGNFAAAVQACGPVWASLGYNSYGQPTNALDSLQAWYQAAGGAVA